MSLPTPRERAAQAFAVIDRHQNEQSSPCPLYAYTQLAHAMDELYGALPDERLHAVWSQIERET